MKQNITLLILGFVLMGLSGCTTTAESQLKESVCKNCIGENEFYRNGVWIERGES